MVAHQKKQGQHDEENGARQNQQHAAPIVSAAMSLRTIGNLLSGRSPVVDLGTLIERNGIRASRQRLVRLAGGSPGTALALADAELWKFREALVAGLTASPIDSVQLAAGWLTTVPTDAPGRSFLVCGSTWPRAAPMKSSASAACWS